MKAKHGILVISHGSRDASWVQTVDEAVHTAKNLWIQQAVDGVQRQKRETTPVYAAYLELVEGRLIQDGVNALEAEGVTHIHVMPLFVSEGSSHVEEIRQAFHLEPISDFIGDLEPLQLSAEIHFDKPIGAEPEIVEIVHGQLQGLSQQPEQEALLLLGHGSSMPFFYEKWESGMVHICEALHERWAFQTVTYAPLLPEGSRDALLQLIEASPRVIVIPLFISPGYFTRNIIPGRLEGLSYVYSGETFLPNHYMSELLARRFGSYALN